MRRWNELQNRRSVIRAERMVKEADIQHEIDTYNEVLEAKQDFQMKQRSALTDDLAH